MIIRYDVVPSTSPVDSMSNDKAKQILIRNSNELQVYQKQTTNGEMMKIETKLSEKFRNFFWNFHCELLISSLNST